MAPRKAAKHPDTEVVDRAAESGDASPLKRKKNVTRSARNDEEKQARLPRAAKTAAKIEQPEAGDAAAIKNAKAKAKTTPRNAAAVKAKATTTTTRKNKEAEDKADSSPADADSARIAEEAEPKKTRTKAAAKKAGMEADEECTSLEASSRTFLLGILSGLH